MDTAAAIIVSLAGTYLVLLGAVALGFPSVARRFLQGFATSPALHYTELGVRLMVGAAFVVRAPMMNWPIGFTLFGWIVLATSACLLLIPWRWHMAFARAAVPRAVRFIGVIGVSSILLGGVILLGVSGMELPELIAY